MSLRYRVISIGALSKNRFWGETAPKRFPHATTTLICDGTQTILVDPSLPAEVLAQRLEERSALTPERRARLWWGLKESAARMALTNPPTSYQEYRIRRALK